MCGIAGYIGESKKPVLTYQLITKLFEKSESRGIDAAGYWGTEPGQGSVLYHKEPGRATAFVKKDMWKRLAKHNPNLLLVHARGASKGVGEPFYNINNHPFTSLDKSIGLVHNGRVDECEYQALKQKYEVFSTCDSEILLRIIEAGEQYTSSELAQLGTVEHPHRLIGMCDIFSLINDGHMAVAVGERRNDERLLWLFRNRHRPLWVVDMRESLGQVFFVSEPVIWEDAVAECSGVKALARTQKLIELPTEEIWFFNIDDREVTPVGVQRFEVCKSKEMKPWQFDGKFCKTKRRSASFQVVTKLDDKDQVVDKAKKSGPQVVIEKLPDSWGSWCEDDFPMEDLERRCDEVINQARDIYTAVHQQVIEQSITKDEFDRIMVELLKQVHDLKGISNTIGQ